MMHPMREMMEKRGLGRAIGMASYCSANEMVIEAAMLRAKKTGRPALIEATANQVNQFGGYTGMTPEDFYKKVFCMAEKLGLPERLLILGGDHLGPLTFQSEPQGAAMDKAEELLYRFARSGFTKIHLDTSMKLKGDPPGALCTLTVARRGVRLYRAAMRGYGDLRAERPDALRPVFVVGSEVPIPGGAREAEDRLSVTRPEAFEEAVSAYRQSFAEAGLPEGFDDVIAFVVQPGVEFGDDRIFMYDPAAAAPLCARLKKHPGLCFEGHSTDYQNRESLKSMVRDGVAILKVGPALTYGLREALFALSFIERELVPEAEQARFDRALEDAMLKNPEYWNKHYHGGERALYLARRYSYSDRCRYYLGLPEVVRATEKLFDNLRKYPPPMGMLRQFLPLSYQKVRDGQLPLDPRRLALEGIMAFIADYEYAVR